MHSHFYLISKRYNWLIELVEIQTMLLVHQSKSVRSQMMSYYR